MDKLSKYSINIVKLKNEDYQFQYTIDKGFFELFDYGLVQNGKLDVDLYLIKSETMLQLTFDIKGEVLLVCDRSLEEFFYPLKTREKLILKFGEEAAQLSDELEVISRNTLEINIAQYIYEFVSISIPMKKLHPRFQTDEDDLDTDTELVYSSSDGDQDETQSNQDQDSEQTIDPRWQVLKKFKK